MAGARIIQYQQSRPNSLFAPGRSGDPGRQVVAPGGGHEYLAIEHEFYFGNQSANKRSFQCFLTHRNWVIICVASMMSSQCSKRTPKPFDEEHGASCPLKERSSSRHTVGLLRPLLRGHLIVPSLKFVA
jgi:hypothetical protein